MVTIEETQSVADLQTVLKIQKANRKKLSRMYSLELLTRINSVVPIVVAKVGHKVVGYCVVMLRQYTREVPELVDHFHQVDLLTFSDKPLSSYLYVMEDQVCVHIDYQRKGIPKQMFTRLSARYRDQFPLMVTGIRKTNIDSLKSHESSKFLQVGEIKDSAPEGNWVIMVSKWQMLDDN